MRYIQLVRFTSLPAVWRLTADAHPSPALVRGIHRLSTVLPSFDKTTRHIAGPFLSLAILPVLSFVTRLVPSFALLLIFQPGGDEGTRTPDIRLAKAALSQLSYIPAFACVCGPLWIRTTDLPLIRGML